MKKNIAVPVREIRAAASRNAEASRLKNMETISAVAKSDQLNALVVEFTAANNRYKKERKRIVDKFKKKIAELPETATQADKDGLLHQRDLEIDAAILLADKVMDEIEGRIRVVEQTLTEEERTERLADLKKQDIAASKLFGVQEMSHDDISHKNMREMEHAEYVEKQKYSDDRQLFYPKQGDQLDALWKGFKAVIAGEPVPKEVITMMTKIDKVKERYPKPADAPADPNNAPDAEPVKDE